ncbi:MAG TPA: proton-conducting transporter membrane subunit [Trebonia sp.]|nr:proton-conducting transporter membrane subunit [Trebonia sp.]
MLGIILALLIIPLAAGIACFWSPARAAAGITIGSGITCFCLVIALIPEVAHGTLNYLSYLRADAVSGIFLLATAFLYAAVAVYAAGYLQHHDARYARRFYLGFNVFAWAMLAAPLMGSLALLWIAVEVTTVVSALLVAIENTDGAAEAAWKYVLIASAGLGLGLLATIFAYYAGAQVLGAHSNLTIQPLLSAGPRLPKTPVELAFLLAVLGYGTKVGLVPVHTWLPDAHSEAPTPVSALLSGALLATSFYAILRFYQVATAALGTGLPRDTLLAFGIASLLLASLYVFGQRDIKRLLAYSSVEHMGILAIGVSFGAPVALAGVLLHVMAHAAAKGNAFMGAGVFTVKYGTKQMSAMRDGLRLLPWSGPLFLLAILALSAFPPSGIFRSEFQIVAGGLSSGSDAAAAVLVILVTLAFFGLAAAATAMVLTSPPREGATLEAQALGVETATIGGAHADGAAVAVKSRPHAARPLTRGEPSAFMVVPVLAGLAVLVLLGVHPPGELTDLITRGAAQLGTP